jgi:hypothetical protein
MYLEEIIIVKIEAYIGKFATTDLSKIRELEIKQIGLDSMTLISFLLELENEGYLDISEIQYDEIPKTIGDILDIIVEFNEQRGKTLQRLT